LKHSFKLILASSLLLILAGKTEASNSILYRGKVRDTFDLGDNLLLMVATDRISAFDVVLPNGIPDKGHILAKLSKFWFGQISHIVPHHFLALADDGEALGKLADSLNQLQYAIAS